MATPVTPGLCSSFQAAGAQLPAQVTKDLRSDQAGEAGAVCIYQAILRISRDPELRLFAQSHLATEQKHLSQIEAWLPPSEHSRLLPVWRLAGFITGALPALLGPRAVYATIEAVETFVNHHYEEQIQRLALHPELGELRKTLIECQADEVAHRDEAASAKGVRKLGFMLRAWCWLVGVGSRGAVALCRHI
jgi:ubiquinone biosynthesis monooxygenase Coq7